MRLGEKGGVFCLRDVLFWDVDTSNFDAKRNRRLIIERVLNYGDISEFLSIMRFYGFDTIRQELMHAGHLEPKTIEFVTSYFKIEKSKLRCYTRKQSNHSHWN